MLTYPTIDSLPDLSAAAMAKARALSFLPFFSQFVQDWDNAASYNGYATDTSKETLFSWSATAGATYDIYSHSKFDPAWVRLYDGLGNAVAVNLPETSVGMDYIQKFVAPYSGTFYVDPGFDLGAVSSYSALSVYENVDTIKANIFISGGAGNDTFAATATSEKINGGGGFDTITYAGALSDYTIIKNGAALTVQRNWSLGDTDTLMGMERIQFKDKALTLEYNDLTQALYVSYFGRAADPAALANFQTQLAALKAPTNFMDFSARYASDPAIRALINSFGASTESKALYGGDTKSFVNAVFLNILERMPQASGLDFWTSAIDSGVLTRANASLSIMAGALSNATDQGKLDGALIANKISAASNFSIALEVAGKADVYAGAAAAGLVRNLLVLVDATTDIVAFQKTIDTVVRSLAWPSIYGSAPDAPLSMPEGHFAQIELIATGSPDLTFSSFN